MAAVVGGPSHTRSSSSDFSSLSTGSQEPRLDELTRQLGRPERNTELRDAITTLAENAARFGDEQLKLARAETFIDIYNKTSLIDVRIAVIKGLKTIGVANQKINDFLQREATDGRVSLIREAAAVVLKALGPAEAKAA